ncbi:hypothetical protein VD0002_g9028 [Verticillium dahliae]|uniref:Uncharacterized protein n=1 Tax=Verticillium dahliae TaxID=27337 RepID=A0AA44WPI8_VERDA|nr:hypothetical protein BJF96_g3571 [Verticillium dahliae]PNH54459.1 hypothetical protein VD0003_g3090 [Verticillium dahliae]PNH58506.1 hypothetical protein VD0002_g9028 [Verticillium dahliae]
MIAAIAKGRVCAGKCKADLALNVCRTYHEVNGCSILGLQGRTTDPQCVDKRA